MWKWLKSLFSRNGGEVAVQKDLPTFSEANSPKPEHPEDSDVVTLSEGVADVVISVQPVIAPRAATSQTNSFTGKVLDVPLRPTEGHWLISAPFGKMNPDLWPHPWGHAGTDFAVPIGTSLFSCFDGQVAWRGYDINFGNRIWILTNHPTYSWIRTLYAHMSEFSVHVGQHVKAGDLIGKSGDTGVNRLGKRVPPHCHNQFELWPSRELLKPNYLV